MFQHLAQPLRGVILALSGTEVSVCFENAQPTGPTTDLDGVSVLPLALLQRAGTCPATPPPTTRVFANLTSFATLFLSSPFASSRRAVDAGSSQPARPAVISCTLLDDSILQRTPMVVPNTHSAVSVALSDKSLILIVHRASKKDYVCQRNSLVVKKNVTTTPLPEKGKFLDFFFFKKSVSPNMIT